MATDFPPSGAGESPRAAPDKIGPVAGNVEPVAAVKVVDPSSGVATPDEHAKSLKAVKTVKRAARVNGEPETFELFHWQHAAAAALHGWLQHAHHEGKPIDLPRADYEQALLAASTPVTRRVDKYGKTFGEPIDSYEAAAKGWPTSTDYEPHEPALSIHYGKAV